MADKAKRPTIIVVLSLGRVEAVQSDCDPENAPLVYVLDYDRLDEPEMAVSLPRPLSSLGEAGPMITEDVHVSEWPLDTPDQEAVARLEKAIAAQYEEDVAAEAIDPADTGRLNAAIDDYVTRTPPHPYDGDERESDRGLAALFDVVERIRHEPYQCPNCHATGTLDNTDVCSACGFCLVDTNLPQSEPVENWRLPPNHRLESHRAAHREPGTAERMENTGGLTL